MFNTLLVLVLLNLVLVLVSLTKRPPAEPDPLSKYGGDALQKAYPGWRKEDVRTLIQETSHRQAKYEPFTESGERPFRGKYVNVDAAGFRLSKDQAPWPPKPQAMNVFVFGGSTTFGYGLPDDQTIVSYLGECALANGPGGRPAVYNFGREGYFSSQELILFQQLLRAGFVPQVAVFIDGMNDFFSADGQPTFADKFRRLMDGKLGSSNPLNKLPMIQAFHRLRAYWTRRPPQKAVWNRTDPELLEGVVNRWLINKKMIELTAAGFGVRPIFVWQPVPTYKYDLNYHFLSSGSPVSGYPPALSGYALMDGARTDGKLGPNVLWLADRQQDKHENLYVDAVHYTADFSKEIAGQICGALNQRPNAQ